MPDTKQIIIQPTASTLLELLQMACQPHNNMSVSLKIEVTTLSEEMDIKEVGELLGCGNTKIHDLKNKGILNPIKRGRKLIFSRSEINQALENGLI